MSVYVDASLYKFGRMTMCHMIADTPEELHAMADKIGVARRWFQRPPHFPHYDICKSKREMAVAAGAIECDRNDEATARRAGSGRHPRAAAPTTASIGGGMSADEIAEIERIEREESR